MPAPALSPPLKLLSIAAPVFNERDNLAPLCAEVEAAMAGQPYAYELILVDDGSTDGSRECLRELAGAHPRLRVLFFRRNYGQTAAMQAGLDAAAGEAVVLMDADLQNDPADIPRLVAAIEAGADLVSGWRKHRQDSGWKTIPSRWANRLIGRVSGVHLHDYGCSLKAYRRWLAKELRLSGEMHRFIPIHAHWLGASITELVVNHRARRHGHSKYGLGRTVKVLLDLLLMHYRGRYAAKPMHWFGTLALRLLASGGMAVFAGAALGMLHSWPGWAVLLAMAGLGGVFTGIVVLLLGLLAEQQKELLFATGARQRYTVAEQLSGGGKDA